MNITIDHVGRSDTETPARLPDEQGVVVRDGVGIHWERHGDGEHTILLMPTWSIIHSRSWKCQIPHLARHFRVISFDGRGNGFSDSPQEASAYAASEFVEDAVAVLGAAGVRSACVAGHSMGALRALLLAAGHADRVSGVFMVGPTIPLLTPELPERAGFGFDDELDHYEGWAKYNRHYWRQDYRGFLEFFFGQIFPEPHSTKQIEDCVAWGLDTNPNTLTLTIDEGDSVLTTLGGNSDLPDKEIVEELCRRVACPILIIHGTDDRLLPLARAERVAELTGGELVRFEGSGHAPHARDPVGVNLLLGDFADRVLGRASTTRTWTRALTRPKRALFVSSPIGLGHAWRDVAIADELRRRVPGLEVHWLAQEPVTALLEQRGETVHPASVELASESRHIDREAGEHRLHVFQALRRLDEIFCANFMVFDEVVHDEAFDVWIGDEAWEVDHFLHENPERKTAPFVWLTDFVGHLPMPEGGEGEALLTADYNAEMIEHVERHPSVRDRAIFIGDPQDIVAGTFGPGLPAIRQWTEQHYSFTGYVPGFDPRTPVDRDALRADLGYGDDPLCIISVGGSGVGAALLRRAIDAVGLAREQVAGLRAVAVTGPRIDPATLPEREGLTVLGYVHELHRHLAACDVAVVQGGLATTMELVAARRPFVSLPLAGHFEQRFHVRHRLDRYGARDWLEYEDADAEVLADAIVSAIGSTPAYGAVDAHGASRAAALIAELL